MRPRRRRPGARSDRPTGRAPATRDRPPRRASHVPVRPDPARAAPANPGADGRSAAIPIDTAAWVLPGRSRPRWLVGRTADLGRRNSRRRKRCAERSEHGRGVRSRGHRHVGMPAVSTSSASSGARATPPITNTGAGPHSSSTDRAGRRLPGARREHWFDVRRAISLRGSGRGLRRRGSSDSCSRIRRTRPLRRRHRSRCHPSGATPPARSHPAPPRGANPAGDPSSWHPPAAPVRRHRIRSGPAAPDRTPSLRPHAEPAGEGLVEPGTSDVGGPAGADRPVGGQPRHLGPDVPDVEDRGRARPGRGNRHRQMPTPRPARPAPATAAATRAAGQQAGCTTTSSGSTDPNSSTSAGATSGPGRSATSHGSASAVAAATRTVCAPTCTAILVGTPVTVPARRSGGQASWTRRAPRRRSTRTPAPEAGRRAGPRR